MAAGQSAQERFDALVLSYYSTRRREDGIESDETVARQEQVRLVREAVANAQSRDELNAIVAHFTEAAEFATGDRYLVLPN
jgi:hypothetical protein